MRRCQRIVSGLCLLMLLLVPACEDSGGGWDPGPGPGSLTGIWEGTWITFDGSSRATVRFRLEQTDGVLDGSITFRTEAESDIPAIEEGLVIGNMVTIRSWGDEFVGVVEGNTIRGTFSYNFLGDPYAGTFEVTRTE